MKIGILTIHTAFNYGAMLQAYALQKALQKLEHNATIIDYYPPEVEISNHMKRISTNPKQIIKYLYARINPNIQKRIYRFNNFREYMQLTRRYRDKKDLYQTRPEFDLYMTGSDQIWNLERGFDSFWFLDFADNKPKVSYASSFGTSSIAKEHYGNLKKHLSTFSSVSVRETDGVRIIKDATQIDATQVLDPTFLLTSNEWDSIATKRLIKEDYILVYGFSASKKFQQLIQSVKQRFNLPIVAISPGFSIPFKVDRLMVSAGPKEFIALIRDAKVICTDSFHGTAFSINFRKNFFSFPHSTRNSRLISILSLTKLTDRQFENPLDILDLPDDKLNINYSLIEPLIEQNRKASMDFLINSLNKLENS